MKRILQLFFGIVAICAAASVYAFTPAVYGADNWTKERLSTVAFGGFLAIGVTWLFLGCLPPAHRRRRKS